MRILYVLPSLQHPTIQRGGLRHWHFLRALARRHAVTLLALGRADVTADARAAITALVERAVIVPVAEPAPGAGRGLAQRVRRELAVRRAVADMRRAFRALAASGRFDVVLFHGKAVSPVLRGFRALPVVVDFCDATSMRLREQLRHAGALAAPWRLWRYLGTRRVERALLARARHVAFISPRDRAAALGDAGPAAVIPNGIDLAYWRARRGAGRAECLVFSGVMSYAPNADAALQLIERVLPAVRHAHPGAELLVVGRDPTPAVIEAARRTPGVTVTGCVDDVRPYLAQGSVYVAPLRYASGLQNKILEALAVGVPVVTTPVVADGLRVRPGAEPPVCVAEGAPEIAAAVLALLDDEAARERLTAEGRRFVEAEFDWEREAERLERLCLDACGQVPSEETAPARGARADARRVAPADPALLAG